MGTGRLRPVLHPQFFSCLSRRDPKTPPMSNSPWILPLLFLTGLCAGFVDSIAGGGGLITLPVLLNAGISPEFALGTNKLQATFGSGSAAWHFAKAGLVDAKEYRIGIACTAIG